jgi:hypothetical protein
MKRTQLLFILLIFLSFFSCNKEENQETIRRKISGKKWMSIHRIGANGEIDDIPAYNITSYYEAGFKLKNSGVYIPKFYGRTNYEGKGSWHIDDNGKFLVIEDSNGTIHQYEIIKLTTTRMELAFPNYTMVFALR